jgi:hypothetical protein
MTAQVNPSCYQHPQLQPQHTSTPAATSICGCNHSTNSTPACAGRLAAVPSLCCLLQQLHHYLVVGVALLEAALVAGNEDQLPGTVQGEAVAQLGEHQAPCAPIALSSAGGDTLDGLSRKPQWAHLTITLPSLLYSGLNTPQYLALPFAFAVLIAPKQASPSGYVC